MQALSENKLSTDRSEQTEPDDITAQVCEFSQNIVHRRLYLHAHELIAHDALSLGPYGR